MRQLGFSSDLTRFVNQSILKKTKGIQYRVSDNAPSTTQELFNSSSLVVWSGASDRTVYQDASINWAFRAWHDYSHIKTQLPFTIEGELELARIQASQFDAEILQDLIYCEVAGQVNYFKTYGTFVENQVEFAVNWMRNKGYKI